MQKRERAFSGRERKFGWYALLMAVTLTMLGVVIRDYVMTPPISYDAPVAMPGVDVAQPVGGVQVGS